MNASLSKDNRNSLNMNLLQQFKASKKPVRLKKIKDIISIFNSFDFSEQNERAILSLFNFDTHMINTLKQIDNIKLTNKYNVIPDGINTNRKINNSIDNVNYVLANP